MRFKATKGKRVVWVFENNIHAAHEKLPHGWNVEPANQPEISTMDVFEMRAEGGAEVVRQFLSIAGRKGGLKGRKRPVVNSSRVTEQTGHPTNQNATGGKCRPSIN